MRPFSRYLAPVVLSGCLVWIVTGCGPSQSASEKSAQAVEVRGELINPPKAPSAAVSEPAPKPVQPALAVASTPSPTELSGGYATLGFDTLASYIFQVSDDGPTTNQTAVGDKADEQIPTTVKAFNQKKVSIKGFMLPLKVEAGVVTEFLIMKDQSMCCYGNVPKINEWVSVKTAGKGVKPIMDQPVSIEGTLHVGSLRENGYLVGIYQMDGDQLVDTKDK